MRISTLFLVSCIFSSGVLASPKKLVRKHSDMIARLPHPEPAPEVVTEQHPVAKRNLSKRCTPRKVTTQSSASTAVAAAPVNVAPSPTVKAPTSTLSTKVNPPVSSSKEPSSSPAPPPPASSSKKPSSSPAPPPPVSSSKKPSSSPAPPPPPPSSSHKPSTSSVHHSATPKPSPSPSPSPAPSPPPSSSSGSGSPFSGVQNGGQFTFYGTGLGACGITNHDTDFIAAASHELFDTYPGATANPNNNPICGKKVKLTYQGNSVAVTITDRCEACQLMDLDLSPDAFLELAPLALGRLSGGKWEWCNNNEC